MHKTAHRRSTDLESSANNTVVLTRSTLYTTRSRTRATRERLLGAHRTKHEDTLFAIGDNSDERGRSHSSAHKQHTVWQAPHATGPRPRIRRHAWRTTQPNDPTHWATVGSCADGVATGQQTNSAMPKHDTVDARHTFEHATDNTNLNTGHRPRDHANITRPAHRALT